jgi:putative Holliday junction resolvase
LTHLAFDFGTSHIGVAVAEHRWGIATGIATINAKRGIPDWEALEALMKNWQPEGLIVGLPLNMDDSESDMSAATRRFGKRLRERYQTNVDFVDERLSTFEARERGAKRGSDHLLAAQIIAETWLNSGS